VLLDRPLEPVPDSGALGHGATLRDAGRSGVTPGG
jgi:hypothetical protein